MIRRWRLWRLRRKEWKIERIEARIHVERRWAHSCRYHEKAEVRLAMLLLEVDRLRRTLFPPPVASIARALQPAVDESQGGGGDSAA